jgi:FecR protein
MRGNWLGKALMVVVLLVCGLFALSALADSLARIVRLSDLDGDVQVDHGSGYEKAIRNMPIMQGMRIQTRDGGLAEVEFENGSTVRLAPNTQVVFPELSLSGLGSKQTTVELKQGTAYFNVAKDKRDQFNVVVGPERATLTEAARLRVDLDEGAAKVAVSKGNVRFEGPAGEAKVDKNHTATFDLSDGGQFTLAKGIEPQKYDKWNQQESSFQSQYGGGNGAVGRSGLAYGMSDLNYYGGWYSVPGFGTMWQPYSTDVGWDPFMDGSWMWYPGAGYTFVSGYPWGWMPYRYGSWAFVPGWGWGWVPGGFSNWNTVPVVLNAPMGFVPPRRPSRGVGHPTIVTRTPAMAVVNHGVTAPPRTGSRDIAGRGQAMVRPNAGIPVHGQVVPVNPRTGAVERGFGMGMPHATPNHSVGGIRAVGPSGGMGRAGGFGSTGVAHSSAGASHASGSPPSHR